MGAREEVGRIVLDMKPHGFRQLRKTEHGWLYGFKEFRMQVPNAMGQPGAVGQQGIDDLRRAWEARRAEVLGAYPGLKLSVAARNASGDRPDTLALEPVMDIEQALGIEGGPPVADAGPVQPAGAGSTPAPPASAAAEAAAPPNNREEDEDMAKRKRRKATKGSNGKGWTCPKCGRQLQVPGRHPATCTGKDVDVPVRRKAAGNGQPPAGRHGRVDVVTADDLMARVVALEGASAALCGAVRAAITERDFYKRERDEAVAQLAAVGAALAGKLKPKG